MIIALLSFIAGAALSFYFFIFALTQKAIVLDKKILQSDGFFTYENILYRITKMEV